ncbi:Smr/MutS family protein [Acidihalobacter ferrooxydans]|uniref:Smr domain-containing protein n=1 Tax=Acidihalobacter ferrooxydans TaxID=1765967 RepID=A0A1P8UHY7_9GAMM|nr:Smr/MutS family protein [Acidihalobacter ferrooxydans]APZ43442.1 hypothetical protein BW247_10380 [Acidihalobacter ferrooxydans]
MHDIDPEDKQLFRATIGDVRRVHHDRHERTQAWRPPAVSQSKRDTLETLRELREDPYAPTDVQPGDPVFYAQHSMSRAVARRLQRGQYRIDAELDLHGMRLDEARHAVLHFLRECSRRDMGCVHIIHGKGWRSGNQGPVLKPNVSHWLRQIDEVLAFCSSTPADGGTGALYVLLKRG